MNNAAIDAAGPRIERFAPANSRWFGVVVVVLAVGFVALLVADDPGRERRPIMIVAILALLTWIVLIRPVVSVNANGLLLQNMLRDIFVPASKIDRCRVMYTLQVATEEDSYQGLGVSRSGRQMVRKTYGRTSLLAGGLSFGIGNKFTSTPASETPAPPPGQAKPGITYQDYVEVRIQRLAAEARPDELEPVLAWAWHAVAALVAVGVLAVLLFV